MASAAWALCPQCIHFHYNNRVDYAKRVLTAKAQSNFVLGKILLRRIAFEMHVFHFMIVVPCAFLAWAWTQNINLCVELNESIVDRIGSPSFSFLTKRDSPQFTFEACKAHTAHPTTVYHLIRISFILDNKQKPRRRHTTANARTETKIFSISI